MCYSSRGRVSRQWTLESLRKLVRFLVVGVGARGKMLSLSYIFGQVPTVNVCQCDLFGHVQIFWSYSFGHVESVK